MRYLGRLDTQEPLHGFLAQLLQLRSEEASFDMHALHPDLLMVLYSELHSGGKLACKFYARKLPAEGDATPEYFRERLREEESRMNALLELGFDRPPHRGVRPLAVNEALEFLLVQEYVEAPNLDEFFRAAYQLNQEHHLGPRLRELGTFLGRLHERSHSGGVQGGGALAELAAKLEALPSEAASDEQRRHLERLHQRWDNLSVPLEAPEVLLHGDCTPTNFLFPSEHEVVAIDLERSHRGDPMADLGSLQAEVIHAAMRYAGSKERGLRHAEELRGGYRPRLEDPGRQERLRLWTAIYLLRMGRNDWLVPEYRRLLVEEAIEWLKR